MVGKRIEYRQWLSREWSGVYASGIWEAVVGAVRGEDLVWREKKHAGILSHLLSTRGRADKPMLIQERTSRVVKFEFDFIGPPRTSPVFICLSQLQRQTCSALVHRRMTTLVPTSDVGSDQRNDYIV